MNTLIVRGPHGAIEFCAHTGHVMTPYNAIPGPYRNYSSANVKEFKTWCDSHQLDEPYETSILCIGLRRYDGQYEAPEEVCREEWAYAHRNNVQVDLA